MEGNTRPPHTAAAHTEHVYVLYLHTCSRVLHGTIWYVHMPFCLHGQPSSISPVFWEDLKNAYGTVLRSAILRGLDKYAPPPVRWFVVIYYGQ